MLGFYFALSMYVLLVCGLIYFNHFWIAAGMLGAGVLLLMLFWEFTGED